MIRLFAFLYFFYGLFFHTYSQSTASLTRQWLFNGRNIYVQNPLRTTSDSFCTKEVYVNNQKVEVNLYSSAYEINLQPFQFQKSDTVNLVIIHDRSCIPRILDYRHHWGPSYRYDTLVLYSETACWIMSGILKRGLFHLEHFENNTWKPIASISLSQTKDTIYSAATRYHSGINKYRVKFVQEDGYIVYSPVTEFVSTLSKLKINFDSEKDRIAFQRKSYFELLDNYGNLVKKGEADSIDLSKLKSNTYYLIVDNRTKKIKLKARVF